ncbi:outer membrane beta-barrel protein [Alphaproteobacteria bacterium]|nr:outer membrane beta-barrel protein [Alphaproteobacteria bacterium]
MSKRFDVLCIWFLSSILFGSVGAIADDTKVNWEGFYAGGYYADSKVDAKRTLLPQVGVGPAQVIDANSEDDIAKNLGFFVGYNKMIGKSLIGIEVSTQNDVASVAANTVVASATGNVRLYRLQEYKVRLGLPRGKLMPYLSLGRGEMQQDFTCCAGPTSFTSTYKSIGIGMEYALGKNAFAGVEYTKADWHYRNTSSTAMRQTNGDVEAFRLRLGYRFN